MNERVSAGEPIVVEPLAAHRSALPTLREWFEHEWPEYYGAGGPGDAARDLHAYANADGLPFGIVALRGGIVCGVAALKPMSIASRAHLTPWVAAGLVPSQWRGQGIGTRLVEALEQHARAQGWHRIHCGTASAGTLLQRCGWTLDETLVHEGAPLDIYSKAL